MRAPAIEIIHESEEEEERVIVQEEEGEVDRELVRTGMKKSSQLAREEATTQSDVDREFVKEQEQEELDDYLYQIQDADFKEKKKVKIKVIESISNLTFIIILLCDRKVLINERKGMKNSA